MRNAARLCLSLGKALRANWYFERAAHYCFHVIGNHSQQPVERIAVLIIQAITVRFRGSAEELGLALKIMKTAERALINYPDRIQLWIRFYLERAKLFRERALQSNSNEEGRACVYYCKADVNAVLRLAHDRKSWVEKAQRVLRDLPEFPRSDAAERSPHGMLSSSIAEFVAL